MPTNKAPPSRRDAIANVIEMPSARKNDAPMVPISKAINDMNKAKQNSIPSGSKSIRPVDHVDDQRVDDYDEIKMLLESALIQRSDQTRKTFMETMKERYDKYKKLLGKKRKTTPTSTR